MSADDQITSQLRERVLDEYAQQIARPIIQAMQGNGDCSIAVRITFEDGKFIATAIETEYMSLIAALRVERDVALHADAQSVKAFRTLMNAYNLMVDELQEARQASGASMAINWA